MGGRSWRRSFLPIIRLTAWGNKTDILLDTNNKLVVSHSQRDGWRSHVPRAHKKTGSEEPVFLTTENQSVSIRDQGP